MLYYLTVLVYTKTAIHLTTSHLQFLVANYFRSVSTEYVYYRNFLETLILYVLLGVENIIKFNSKNIAC